ncbi:hypothetical protein SAMN05877809_101470 [Rhodobacter sp. JA431]|uniref:leucine-rich repeat domain-containing protein n=1 Tax=Rhodobacter sp. JA431 TaxID=570013 RepID=UPI000BCAFCAF|nr:leucine-rich repeat domain-containing protein [Rhodobacter sp. JA431]SOB91979.1 hypothetical protein SAMN05877809_101470 [Rhodobacter sp. JA431]
MSAAEKAYAAAVEEIARVKREGRRELHLSMGRFRELKKIPEEVCTIPELRSVDLSHTRVADLTPLREHATLQILLLEYTKVKRLSTIEGLTRLRTLSLYGSSVVNIETLSGFVDLTSLFIGQTRVEDLSPISGLASLRDLILNRSLVADMRPLRSLSKLTAAEQFSPGLVYSDAAACKADVELMRLSGIKSNAERARETLAYLNTLPPWPEPYLPKARPDGKPPEWIGGAPSAPPAVRTAEAQIRALLRHATITRVSAASFAAQITEALQGVPATHGNQLAPVLQVMLEVRDVLETIARDRADAQSEETLLRLRIAHLETVVDKLTTQLADAEKAREAAELLAQKDGFMASYRKSLGTAAGVGTIGLIGVGVPTAAIYFLGAEHPLVQAFLTVTGRLPKS